MLGQPLQLLHDQPQALDLGLCVGQGLSFTGSLCR
jgi:hypothetical protein